MTRIDVCSDVTGTIVKVTASAGAQVSEGDAVVLIESMKMEIPLMAPEEGRVIEVLVEEGTSVADGDRLMVLEVD